MATKCLTEEEIRWLVQNNNIEVVRIECEDTNGISRGFNLDVDYFIDQLHGGIQIPKGIYAFKVSYCEIISGTDVLEECGYSNCVMYPDINTFRLLPWEPKVASILSDVKFTNGNFMPLSPRNICKKQLERLNKLGLQLYSAYEFEFYLLSKETKLPVTNDENVFSTLCQSTHLPFVKDVMKSMKGIGIKPEVHHRECGQGQNEITFSPSFDIQSPDNAFRFKNLVKEIAVKHGLLATFISKPFADQLGSSGHFNHSLWDIEGKCIMYDANRPYGLSEFAENWLAGLRHHSNALMSLATTTDNCYERVRRNGLNPINNSWGFDNRTVSYRIKNKDSSKLYLENRVPGASVNPYLFTAGCIIAGIDGIKRKLKLDVEPCLIDIEKAETLPKQIEALPTTMEQGLLCLEENETFVQELGPEFMKCFMATRREEIKFVNNLQSSNDMFLWYRNNYAEFL